MVGNTFWIAIVVLLAGAEMVASSELVPQAREAEPSIVLVRVDRFEFVPDQMVSIPGEPNSLFLGGVYRAHARTLKLFAGPPIGKGVQVYVAGLHIERLRNVKAVMIVRTHGAGTLWAGQHWEQINEHGCLSADDIERWRLGSPLRRCDRSAGMAARPS